MREVKTFKAQDGKVGFTPAELVRILTPAASGGWTVKITQGFRGQVLQVQLTQDTGYGISTTFTCTGNRTSPCHVYPDCLCAVDQVPCDHEPVPHDECWMQGWMDDAGCAEECAPDGDPVRSGPINVTWNGDCVEWEYAEPAVSPGGVHQARADAFRGPAVDLYRDRQGGA